MNASDIKLNEEEQIMFSCLNLENPKSFFLFAGAGSGKTRSLVEVLKKFKIENNKYLQLNSQKVAIITYTNAACEEIKRRLEYDSTFVVSTIHSFSWELIKPFQRDIREWLSVNLRLEIDNLQEEERRGRPGTKTSIDRIAKINSKQKRLDGLDTFSVFSYNPNGTNTGRDSLNHSEILKITSNFLISRPMMQQILVKKFPILLIDESQDTKKELIEAFFEVEKKQSGNFSLGLFGDTMQRIYTDGKPDLGQDIPPNWELPAKKTNYRCPPRIITLINKIRSDVDNQVQKPFKKEVGYVRLFVVDSNLTLNINEIEKAIAEQMSEITSDEKWKDLQCEVKSLTLEHHMAAKRGGFFDFFEPLYNSSSDSTGLLDGTMQGISFLIKQILPLFFMMKEKNDFEVANIIKAFSPLLDKKRIRDSEDQLGQIRKANFAVNELMQLWGNKFDKDPDILTVLKKVSELNIFTLPETLSIITNRKEVAFEDEDPEEKLNEIIEAWEKALKAPFNQLERYYNYITEKSSFGTHQGVKGLEFPRVMVILDDEEARGFLFSYEKLLGAKELTATDRKNISEGKETSLDRTRRLFYVSCSRAEESLAIIAYSKNPSAVKQYAISQNWFKENEVVQFNSSSS